MPTVEEIAATMAYEFLRSGNYSASIGPEEIPALIEAVGAVDQDVPALSSTGFAGLAVQSVGYEESVEEPKVHVYLTRGSKALIKALPPEFGGVSVVAHQMGSISVRPERASSSTNRGHYFERDGRVCCGSSCAPTSENCTGTFGALVRLGTSAQLYLISNNHVLAGCNHVPRNQPILSPSNNDSRPDIQAPREIGRHHQIRELRSGSPNFVAPCESDIAIARVIDANALSSWQGDQADGYDTPPAVRRPATGHRVKKFGRTTGLTFGRIEAHIASPMPVFYQAKHFKGVVWFKDVWTVVADEAGAFALPGDSGSLVVTEDGAEAIGLVFAANNSGEYAWVIPFAAISTAFDGLRLVHGHGI